MTLKEVLAQDPRFAVLPCERSFRRALNAEAAKPIALTNEQMGAMFIENAKTVGLKVITENSSTQRSSRTVTETSAQYLKFRDKLDALARTSETKESFLKRLEKINKKIVNSPHLSPIEQTDLLNTGEMMKQMAVWMEGAKDRYFARVGWTDQAHVPSINNYPSIYKNHATEATVTSWWSSWGRCAAGILGGAISGGLGGCGVGAAAGLGFASIPGCGVGAIIGTIGGGLSGASSACD